MAEGSWHRVAAASQVAEDAAIGVEAGGRKIALCRVGGTIHAFENICPHAYALLSDGFVERNEIECPLHAARFEISTGKCLCSPADRDLATYPVKVEGDDVLVEIAQ